MEKKRIEYMHLVLEDYELISCIFYEYNEKTKHFFQKGIPILKKL